MFSNVSQLFDSWHVTIPVLSSDLHLGGEEKNLKGGKNETGKGKET